MKISVCKNYNSKRDKDFNHRRVAHGWSLTDVEWSEQEIKNLVTTEGVSGNEYSDGHKHTDSWVCTHTLMLDFDDGFMTVDQLLDEQTDWQFDSYIFTSQNHQLDKPKGGKIVPPCDKLRVLIPLVEPITNEFDRKAVEQAFIRKYNAAGQKVIDTTFMGQCRYFAHGTDEVSSFVDGKGPMNWRNIPDLYKQTEKPGRPSKVDLLKQTFRLDQQVKDGNGRTMLLKDVSAGTPIFCPVCGDASHRTNDGHNAVVLENDEGIPFIYCSSCDSREMGVSGKGVYNLHPDDAFRLKSEEQMATVLIDTLTSTYRSVCKEPGLDEPVIRQLTTLNHVEQFNKAHGLPNPEVYPRARLELHPEKDDIINFEEGYVNKYMVPEVLRRPVPEGHIAKLPYYIGKIIDHVLAHEKEIKEHFYNDLAHLVQTRRKMITSYLWQGTEGSGKGVLFTKVLRPMFGERYCTSTDQDAFGGQFNGFLEDNVLVLVNEVSGNFSTSEKQNLSTIEKMKIAITDEYIQIESKHRDRINGRNCCSFFFATNRRHGVVLSSNDRRFNVAPRQEVKIHNTDWWPGYDELKRIVSDELQEFVWYLNQYLVDHSKIGKVIDNEPKRVLQALSRSNAEDFFDAVNRADIDWIRDNMAIRNGYNASDKHHEMKMLVDGLKEQKAVSMKALCTLYNYINHKDLSVISFGKAAAGYLPKAGPIKIGKRTIWGIRVDWKGEPGLFD
jgi:hypothetical protein